MSSIGGGYGPRVPRKWFASRLLWGREETSCFGIGVSGVRLISGHGVRLGELSRRPELAPVELERGHQLVGREVRGEGKGQPERGREPGAVGARTENPEGHVEARRRERAYRLPLAAGPKRSSSL